jgi:phosphopantetheinyl transferase
MPLLKEWDVSPHALAAIWKIEEPESFFTEATGIIKDIKNEKRRMEHLAGRYLLKHLKEDFPLHIITPDEQDKPRILNNEYFFSISHSYPYVAAVIDPHNEAGIDIQTPHARIERIQHKFLSPYEQEIFKNDPTLITIAWTAKEAAYKYLGKRGVEFIDHLEVVSFDKNWDNFNINIYHKLTIPATMLTIQGTSNADFSLAWVAATQPWEIY